MVRALVLNATYEPLSVVSGRRAALLVLDERATPVVESSAYLRSATVCLPIPSVVRLRYYVRVPYRRRGSLTRGGIFRRDGGRCQYCERAADSIDHVIPKSRGGTNDWRNMVAACRRCNSHKRDRLPEECGMKLLRRPAPPGEYGWVLAAVGSIPGDWMPYLGDLEVTESRVGVA